MKEKGDLFVVFVIAALDSPNWIGQLLVGY